MLRMTALKIAGGYIVVSNASVRFREMIVMYPPIAVCYIVVSNATVHESIVMNPPSVGVLCCILLQSSDGQFQCSPLLSSLTCRSTGSSSALGWAMLSTSHWLAVQDTICIDLSLIQVPPKVPGRLGQQIAPNLPHG